MGDTIIIETPVATVLEVSGKQGPQGAPGAAGSVGPKGDKGDPGSGIETLTTKGDLLSRNDSTAIRVGIGSTGQVLKVSAQGLPTWANESGAVTSVNGATGAVTVAAAQHAASHAAGTKAQYIGQVGGMTENVIIRANNTGTAGNSITLAFDGVDDIATVLNAWNSVNPSNQATLILGHAEQVPDNGEAIALSGGVAGGSDPFKNINQNLGTTDTPVFNGLVVAKNGTANSLAFGNHVANFVAENGTADAPLVLIGGTGNIEIFKDSEISKALAYGFAVPSQSATDDFIVSLYNGSWKEKFRVAQDGTATIKGNIVLRDNDGNQTATFDAQSNLTDNRTYDLPDRSGELMIVGDAPASHAHGNLTNDGKLGSTSGLPVVTTTAGAVTTLALGTANQVLRVNSGATGVEFADPAAAGVTSVTGTAPIVSSGGTTPAISISAATTSAAGSMSAADKTKLDGIAAGATANSSDATLLNRANHTGTQAANTITGLAASATTDTTSASNISSGTLGIARIPTGTTSSTVALGNHSHELTALAATGATNGHVLTANGSGGVTFAAASGGIGGSTGSVSTAILRASGTGGSTAQSSDIIVDDYTATTQGNITIAPRAVSFSATIAASDDFVTATGHTFFNGDQVTFTSLTGGAGLSANIRYFVRDAATNVFKVATTVSGAAVDVTTNYTAATVERITAVCINTRNVAPFIVGPKPDGTALGGDARGLRAINIAMSRDNASEVARGDDSIAIGTRTDATTRGVAIGRLARATGTTASTAIGQATNASAQQGTAIGTEAQATALSATALGNAVSATAQDAVAIGSYDANDTGSIATAIRCVGLNAIANMRGMLATRPFNAVYWGGQTTDATANVELNLDATATNRMTIAANTAVIADIYVIARRTDNTKFLAARRWVAIRRDGSNNTALIGAVQTIGTDQSEGSPTWTFTIDADDTASVESLRVRVTGAASETVNWRVCAIYRVVA